MLELAIVPAPVGLEQAIAPVPVAELALPIVLAAALELPIVPVAAELELVQVEAVPVPGHPRSQLAVALRTKSVTGAHRHGLVPLLAAEDLAAVAETTRERAAAEAVIAWGAAE